jgi:hypothetical protein
VATGTVYFDALTGVRNVILGLGLKLADGSALPVEQVYLRDLLDDRQVVTPCVVIAKPERGEKTEVNDDGTNTVGHPVALGIIAAENQDLTLEEWPLAWRQAVVDAFDNKHPAAVSAALGAADLRNTTWEAGPVISGKGFEGNLLLSTGWVWVWVWKPR